jgi:tetratricopeptide (TPR) repeat protein
VRLEKEAASRKWIPPVLYAWALIDVALGDYIASPDAQKFTLAEKTLRHFIVKKHAEGFAALGLALIYDVLGDGKKAVAELNRVKRANDTALGIFYHPAISSLREGNVERAVIMLEREFLIKGIYSDAGARGGKKKHGYGIVQKLFNEYEQAIKSEILRRPYLFNLPLAVAYNYERQNENEKAVLILKNIIGGNPAYSSGRRHAWMAHNLLAWVYSAKLGRNITEARSPAEKAVSLNPKSGAAFDTLGWTHLKMGDHKKALPLLKNASKLDPDPEIKEHIRIVEDILKSPPMIR